MAIKYQPYRGEPIAVTAKNVVTCLSTGHPVCFTFNGVKLSFGRGTTEEEILREYYARRKEDRHV